MQIAIIYALDYLYLKNLKSDNYEIQNFYIDCVSF